MGLMLVKRYGHVAIINKESLKITFFFFFKKICPRPKLALNGVGGKSATELLRHLQ